MKSSRTIQLIGLAAALPAAVFFSATSTTLAQEKSAAPVTRAIAVIHPTDGNQVHGTVTFTKEKDGIRVVAEINGLSPGPHGFHVHEFGDCSANDGTSAGGHFNPTGMPHAGPDAAKRHVGDLGNITADASGVARLDTFDTQLSFVGPTSILGRGVIVHAKADDLKSQPSGNAGARIGCGVIGIAKP